MNKYVSLLLWIVIYLGVGFVIGQSSQASIDTWYKALEKPFFNPPNRIFPIAWSILYVLIATAGWCVWQVKGSKGLKRSFILYSMLNWTWTPIFFGAQAIHEAFVWIVLINITTVYFIYKAWSETRFAMYLMIPPLLWTLFAGLLNYYIWVLNS